MVGAAQRIAHYENRMQSSLIDPVLTAVNAAAIANYTAYAMDFVTNCQMPMRAILNAAGVSPTAIALYEAYNGELYHASKTVSGAAAVTYATILVTKYTAWLGPGAAVTLKAIASGIYGIIVP